MRTELQRDGLDVHLVQGDITKIDVDAIVNAANSGLRGGGGVDGAIHRAGGPAIMAECRKLGGCPTGEARLTTAGNLPARFVIHTVGPIWHGGNDREADLLAAAYRSSITLAKKHNVASIAFASISTGVYGYPIEHAARIALTTVLAMAPDAGSVQDVTFVLFSAGDFQVYAQALQELAG